MSGGRPPWTALEIAPPNPSGLCMCGCGGRAPIAKETSRREQHVKGHPIRFINGHRVRLNAVDPITRYIIEDLGYKTPCWRWTGELSVYGYGVYRKRGAHIEMYERARGPVPVGHELDHLCRVHACVNPDHLEVVTHAENVRRGACQRLTEADVEEILQARETLILEGGYKVRGGGGNAVRAALAAQLSIHPDYVGQLWRQADQAAA